MKNSIDLAEVDEHLTGIEHLLKILRNRVAEVAEKVRIAAAQRRKEPAAAGRREKAVAKGASVKRRSRR